MPCWPTTARSQVDNLDLVLDVDTPIVRRLTAIEPQHELAETMDAVLEGTVRATQQVTEVSRAAQRQHHRRRR